MGNSCCSAHVSSTSHSVRDAADFVESPVLPNQNNLKFIVEEASDISRSNFCIEKYAIQEPQKLFLKTDVRACFKHAEEQLSKNKELQLTDESDEKTVFE